MHEMTLAQSILSVVLEAAKGQRVRNVRLHIGKLQMVVPDSLDFSYRLVAAGTPAADAILEMREIPAVLRCGQCEAAVELDLPPFNCRRCGSPDVEVMTGDEILVDAVELENTEAISKHVVKIDELIERRLTADVASESGPYVWRQVQH